MPSLLRFMDWPMRAKMAVLLVLASLVPLSISTWNGIRQTRERLVEQSAALLTARGDELVGRIDTLIEGYQSGVARMARSPNIAAMLATPAEQREGLQPRFAAVLDVWPATDRNIRGVAVLDATGTVISTTEPVLFGRNLSHYDFAARALQGKDVVSDVFVAGRDLGGVSTFALLAPARSADGRVLGAAVFWVRAAALVQMLRDANGQAGEGSYAILFDHLGVRIAHSYREDLMFRPSRPLPAATVAALAAEERFGPNTRALLEDVRPIPPEVASPAAAGFKSGVARAFAINAGRWTFVATRQARRAPWTVQTLLPEQVIDAKLAPILEQQLLLGALITLLALAAGAGWSALILRPIGRLSAGARQLAKGDLQARVPVDRRDELGQLGESFNDMARRLEIHTADQLEASEGRFRSLFYAMREGFCAIQLLYDAEGRPVDCLFLEVNPAFSRLSGIEGAQGKRSSEVGPIEPGWLERYAHVAKTGEVLHLVRESVQLGRWFDVRIFRMGRPEAQMVAVLFDDVTEKKQAEERQREQLERLSLLQQVTRAIAERHDLASIYQVVIRTLEDRLPVDFACICRYLPEQERLEITRVGLRSEALIPALAQGDPPYLDIEQCGLSRCVAGQFVYEPDVSQSGLLFPRRLAAAGLRAFVAAPLRVESTVFGALLVVRREVASFSSSECEFLQQLSEHVGLAAHQAQLYAALQAAYDDLQLSQQAAMQQERLRALGQMASGIAHDINNAVSPAALYVDALLEREKGLSEAGRRQLETIQRAIDDVAATVARMREFYRRRDLHQAFSPVRMNELVLQVIEMTRARWSDMANQRGTTIDVVTQLESALPVIMGIESELREALVNLVFNAVDAMPQGGTLTLKTFSEGLGRVFVEVDDTGVGMDEDARRRCLEPFFTTKGERGTGLGLAMVYGVLQRHGADVQIHSAVGKGTTVRLEFPAVSDPGSTAPRVMPPVPTGMRILLVDDDPVLLRSLLESLEADGHVVQASHGGEEGIMAFRESMRDNRPFDVVITDLGMPYVDGRQVAASIKAASPSTPVIMLTGWGQRLQADQDVPPHVDLMLNKPPKLRDLREALAGFCAV